MTPEIVTASKYIIAVLWLLDGSVNPGGGTTLISNETFPSVEDCVAAFPRYDAAVERDFHSRGRLVCVKVNPQ